MKLSLIPIFAPDFAAGCLTVEWEKCPIGP